MVVSGIPVPNGKRHVGIMADMSLVLLQAVFDFVIPHMPETQLRIRIGIVFFFLSQIHCLLLSQFTKAHTTDAYTGLNCHRELSVAITLRRAPACHTLISFSLLSTSSRIPPLC